MQERIQSIPGRQRQSSSTPDFNSPNAPEPRERVAVLLLCGLAAIHVFLSPRLSRFSAWSMRMRISTWWSNIRTATFREAWRLFPLNRRGTSQLMERENIFPRQINLLAENFHRRNGVGQTMRRTKNCLNPKSKRCVEQISKAHNHRSITSWRDYGGGSAKRSVCAMEHCSTGFDF